jgi:adenylate kinase family enzyme
MKLAITGKMGSGKTSIAKYLVEKYNFTKFSFADDVKLYATEIFDINIKIKDRKLLQQFATKMKEIDENIWIKRLDNKIKDKDISDNIIIDDLRYPNEELYLISNGFKILKLDIDTELQNNRLKNTYINDFDIHIECKKHDSEMHTQFFYHDFYYFINTNTEKNIYKYIDNLIKN